MKFVVTQGYLNEVDVRLHWESKKKIKKIASWTAIAVGAVVVGVSIANQNQDPDQTEE